MTTIRHIVATLACGWLAFASAAQAGDGFPPLGAWAYGTGSPTYAVGHHGLGRAAYAHHGVRYRSVWHRPRVATYSWGHYGHLGYASRHRLVHHAGLYGQPWGYRGYGYSAYYANYPVVSLPSYYYANYYAYPSYYSYPGYHYVPTCGWPGIVSVGGVSISTSGLAANVVPSTRGRVSTADADAWVVASSHQQPLNTRIRLAADTSSSDRLVSLEPAGVEAVARENALPAPLLAAADAIFQAGGYRQAATAYAELDVRYGSSDLLMGRRFVAQVASGDVEQAAVIVTLAQIAGREFQQVDLPGGNLDQLFANDPAALTAATERLAARALARSDEAEPLQTIGHWLRLVGDLERATMFLQMAERLSVSAPLDPPDMPISKSELVSLE